MAGGRGGLLALLALLALLSLPGVGARREGSVLIQMDFFQREEPEGSPEVGPEGGQFMFDFDGDEIFHVDLQRQETVWRLPEFGTFAAFEAQGALQSIAVDRQNLEIMMHNSNRSRAAPVAPEVVTLFPKHQEELGEPNVLICYVENFWPPVLSISWRRNGQEVTEGVLESIFYPRQDHSFRKFSYLPFLPARGDLYSCQVEHEGLERPLQSAWDSQLPPPVSDTSQTLLCALGLAVGIVGISVGTVLIIKTTRANRARAPRDPL